MRCLVNHWLAVALLLSIAGAACAVEPGEPIEYKPFFPDRWEKKGQSTKMVPWEGEHVVLLTTTDEFEPEVMDVFLKRLDAGWKTYAELVGRSPRPFKQQDGKVTIAAVPDASYTCGIGCGYIGAGGIEVGGFYGNDYPLVKKNREAFPHYYFYEMGRNYFVFGDKHDAFTTGFAVFMRYVCMDAVGCEDLDARTRRAIEEAESRLKETDLTFLQAFTNVDGANEKGNRIPGLSPSDQPVMYASAMLKLRRDCGGDEFLERFHRFLDACPRATADTKDGALAQSICWMLSASCAARRDLSDVFVDRWRLPLGKETREALGRIDWEAEDLSPVDVLGELPKEGLPPVLIGEAD